MTSKPKEGTTPDQHALLDAVRNSAQQIWQAGLGAFAKAQQEGSDLFDKLVRDGSELHRLTQFLPEGAAGKVGSLVGKQASGSWDKLEKIFEDRVARALHSLGVPTQEDFDRLAAEIEALKAGAAAAPAKPAARKTAPKTAAKPAAKKAAKGTRTSAAKAPKTPARTARTGAGPRG